MQGRAGVKIDPLQCIVERQDADSTAREKLFFEPGEAPFDEAPFGFLPRQCQGAPVGRLRLRGFAQAPAKIGARCVRQPVIHEFTACK